MSAFIVDKSTMQAVVTAICGRSFYGQIIPRFLGFSTDTMDTSTRIGRGLYALNINAVTQRYGGPVSDLPGPSNPERTAKTFRGPDPSRQMTPTPELIRGLKALRCLIYQCAEGTVPDMAEYAELEQAAGAIAQEIVARLPEYDAAPWG